MPPPESTSAVGGRVGPMHLNCASISRHKSKCRTENARCAEGPFQSPPPLRQLSSRMSVKAPSARPQAALTLEAAGRADIGKRRQHNEDVLLVREDLGLFVVADGAGGHNAGEVASALACRSMENYFGA